MHKSRRIVTFSGRLVPVRLAEARIHKSRITVIRFICNVIIRDIRRIARDAHQIAADIAARLSVLDVIPVFLRLAHDDDLLALVNSVDHHVFRRRTIAEISIVTIQEAVGHIEGNARSRGVAMSHNRATLGSIVAEEGTIRNTNIHVGLT